MRAAFFLAAALAFALPAAAGEVRLRDDRGVEHVLPQPAARIVTLAPHLTELVFAAGAGAKLVGVSAYSDFPPEAAKLPVISDSAHVNLEELIRLKPDLVLAWQTGNPARNVAAVEARGMRVFVTEPSRLEDIPRLVRTIGRLAGTTAIADAQAAAIEARFAKLREANASKPEIRVFYEIWHEPLLTVNGRHYVTAMLALCGGSNVFAGAAPLTPAVSREQLLAIDPDAILVSAPPPQAASAIAAWKRWPMLHAVKRDALYPIDPALVTRMGVRVTAGAELICAVLDRARAAAK